MTAYVLDASALLAYLTGEPGVDVVAEALSDRAAISAANYAEVLSKLADEGEDPKAVCSMPGDARSCGADPQSRRA